MSADKMILPAWYVVFDPMPSRIWWHRALRLRFKHCWCFAWDAEAQRWIVLHPGFDGFLVRAFNEHAGAALWLSLHQQKAVVVLTTAECSAVIRPRLLGSCVTIVVALLGLRRCCALTPHQLYRTLLRRGAIQVLG